MEGTVREWLPHAEERSLKKETLWRAYKVFRKRILPKATPERGGGVMPPVWAGTSLNERLVVLLLEYGFDHAEVAKRVDLSVAEVTAIKTKFDELMELHDLLNNRKVNNE
jgi:hypothetical protein